MTRTKLDIQNEVKSITIQIDYLVELYNYYGLQNTRTICQLWKNKDACELQLAQMKSE